MQAKRRDFLKTAAAFAGMQFLPAGIVGVQARPGANNKVNLGFVGVGGRGGAHIGALAAQNYVALCDIDSKRMAPTAQKHPQAKLFSRYEQMLEQVGDQLDAVVVTTADHTHYEVSKACMEAGKHMLVEKPLAQSVAQVRALKALAQEKGVVALQGNQGHCTGSIRTCKEIIQAGQIGQVTKVECWTDRPQNDKWGWDAGTTQYPAQEAVPEHIDWEAWLGTTLRDEGFSVPYSSQIHPFLWRGFQAFGCGALGDMGCHIINAAHWALDLGQPSSVYAECSGLGGDVSYPETSRVVYKFPARGQMPAVELIWYDGENRPEPPAELEEGRQMGNPSGGSFIYGSQATIMGDSHSSTLRIIPESKHHEMADAFPEKTIPRVRSMYHEFLDCITNGKKPGSDIAGYGADLSEAVLLGVLAQRFPGQELHYDAESMQITNHEGANEVLTHPRYGVAGTLEQQVAAVAKNCSCCVYP